MWTLNFDQGFNEENVACAGKKTNAYRVVMGKTEGKRLLGRPRSRWEYTVKIDRK